MINPLLENDSPPLEIVELTKTEISAKAREACGDLQHHKMIYLKKPFRTYRLRAQYVRMFANGICVIGAKKGALGLSDAPPGITFTRKPQPASNGQQKRNRTTAPDVFRITELCHVADPSNKWRTTFHACVEGILVQINDKLVTNPNLLVTNPEDEGWLAIIYCSTQQREKLQQMETSTTFEKDQSQRLESTSMFDQETLSCSCKECVVDPH